MRYHDEPESYDGSRIVGFEIVPSSIEHVIKSDGSSNRSYETCDDKTHQIELRKRKPQGLSDATSIVWT